MSSGKEWLTPARMRLTSATLPVSPETTQFDGYGVAEPKSRIVIRRPRSSLPGAGVEAAAELEAAAVGVAVVVAAQRLSR